MRHSVSIFQRKRGRHLEWYTVGLGSMNRAERGGNGAKVEQRMVDGLRKVMTERWPQEVEPVDFVRGRRLEVVSLELSLGRGSTRVRLAGKFPLILEPRTRGPGSKRSPIVIAYHPMRQDEWWVHEPDRDLAEEARVFFQERWEDLVHDEDGRQELLAHPRDKLKLIAYSVRTRQLADRLKKDEKPDALAFLGQKKRKRGAGLLAELGTNLTLRALDDRLDPGMPRSPYREQLQQLLCGTRKAPTLLVGPPGVGKRTLLRRLVHDLLAADDYPSHRNLDQVHAVWQISGRRIIAGMSYLGQWEQRCVELLEACQERKVVLWVDDLHAWGRIGESRESDRSLATFFRGPVARGELIIVAPCTPEQRQQLEDDAGNLAGAFTTLHVEPTDAAQTMGMIVHQARALELRYQVAFDPRCFATVYELGAALSPGAAYPGKALDLLLALAIGESGDSSRMRKVEEHVRQGKKINAIKAYREITGRGLRDSKEAVEAFMDTGKWGSVGFSPRSAAALGGFGNAGPPELGPRDVVDLISRRTGMPAVLLTPDQPLAERLVAAHFRQEIMGQEAAVEAASRLVLRIKAGLSDPGRPYGVFLFTGPTGTGKTEMAKCIAEYLYGDTSRLLRFDMSEYNGMDAASRLIGDRFRPEGALTGQVKAQPFCVVLLDEVEKAAPAVLNLMLQLFDDGRLTDATGTVVDFSHAVVIMTSNLGAKANPSLGFGGEVAATAAGDVEAAVRAFFPPELFNRIDKVVQFGALSAEAAHRIARRELERLLSRRGLTERNVFVRFTDEVVELAVREGFTRKDGARSLKRYLEDHVGARLADHLAGSAAAAVRDLWLYVRDGELQIWAQHLTEAEAIADGSRFAALVDSGMERLRAEIPAALERVDTLLAGERFQALEATLSRALTRYQSGEAEAGDAVFHLEELRGSLAALREKLVLQTEYDPGLAGDVDEELRTDVEGELAELEAFSTARIAHAAPGGHGRVEHKRTLDRRARPALPLQSRPDFIAQLFELYFTERALGQIDEPGQHEVLVELTRISRSAGPNRFTASAPGLLEWLASSYVYRARGEVDGFAWVDASEGDLRFRHVTSGRSARRVSEMLDMARTRVVLRVVGPSVRAFFEAEEGTHVRHSLAGSTEIVRVRVLEGGARDPLEHLRALDGQRGAFAAALQSGAEPESLPENPDQVMPILRRYHFDPPAREGQLATIEIEDHALAHATETRVRALGEVLPSLWLLRLGAEREATS